MKLLKLMRSDTPLDKVFHISILLKGLNGLLEVIGGILLLFLNPVRLNQLVQLLTQEELRKDPHDFIANYLINAAHQFSVSTQLFGSVYLLSHGVIKVFLVMALFQRKLWAYPTAIIFFSLFIIYQMYRYSYEHSIGFVLLTLLDIFVVVLTWLEFRRLRNVAIAP